MYTSKHRLSIWLSASALLLAPGCGLEPVDEGGGEDMLPAEVQRAFDESCATTMACHAEGAAQVVLAAPASGDILTMEGEGGPLVTLGSLDESYLAQKILGGPGIIGARMPPQPQSERDDVNAAVIIGWIAGVPLEGGETGGGDGDGDGDTGMDCFIDAPLPDTYSFETDIWPILEARCATMVCHGTLSPLMPDAMGAHDNLVSMPASMAALDYVEPMSPDTSYMWHKLLGTQSTVPGGGGSTMPAGSMMCTTELQAIYGWITSGAEL